MEQKPTYVDRDEIPSQNLFRFQYVTFNSVFDSGNLGKAVPIDDTHYQIWTAPDCAGTTLEAKSRSWFHFSVQAPPTWEVSFTIMNMNHQGRLYKDGLRPFYRTEGSKEWSRTEGSLSYQVTSGDCGVNYEVTFSHTFDARVTYFAFCFPWSYSECQTLLDVLEIEHSQRKDLVWHRENLIYSCEGRRMDVLTLSSPTRQLVNREPPMEGIFPDGGRRSPQWDKPIAFVTARVHPGETPGSWACNGLLKFLLSSDPRAKLLLSEFVFKIIPMLNPDGVYRGFYRSDTYGKNLNRVYLNPSAAESPTVFAVNKLVDYYAQNIYFYIDLHAHGCKKGTFLFGNQMDYRETIEAFHFAKLMELNCVNFELDQSSFNDKNLVQKGDTDGKEGCSRAAIGKRHGISRIYTLEVNYNRGKNVNDVPAIDTLQENDHWNPRSAIYAQGAPLYTTAIFEDMGKAVLVSLLDMFEKNPFSRIFKSNYTKLAEFKLQSAFQLIQRIPFRTNTLLRRFTKDKESLNRYLIYKDSKEKQRLIEESKGRFGKKTRSRSKTERIPKPVDKVRESLPQRFDYNRCKIPKMIQRSSSNKATDIPRKIPLAQNQSRLAEKIIEKNEHES